MHINLAFGIYAGKRSIAFSVFVGVIKEASKINRAKFK